MATKDTNPISRSRAVLVMLGGAALVLTGCASQMHPTAAWQPQPKLMEHHAGSSSALVFSPGLEQYSAAHNDSARSRNEDLLAHQDRSRRDELLGIAPERRATLDRARTYRGARRAEDYVYPSQQDARSWDQRYRRPYRRDR